MHKFVVKYLNPKKKGYASQSATFFKLDDAIFWENHVKQKGAKEVQIHVG